MRIENERTFGLDELPESAVRIRFVFPVRVWMYYGTSVLCGRTTVLVYGGGALDCPTQALEGSVGCPTLSACIRGHGLPTTAKGPWGGPCWISLVRFVLSQVLFFHRVAPCALPHTF